MGRKRTLRTMRKFFAFILGLTSGSVCYAGFSTDNLKIPMVNPSTAGITMTGSSGQTANYITITSSDGVSSGGMRADKSWIIPDDLTASSNDTITFKSQSTMASHYATFEVRRGRVGYNYPFGVIFKLTDQNDSGVVQAAYMKWLSPDFTQSHHDLEIHAANGRVWHAPWQGGNYYYNGSAFSNGNEAALTIPAQSLLPGGGGPGYVDQSPLAIEQTTYFTTGVTKIEHLSGAYFIAPTYSGTTVPGNFWGLKTKGGINVTDGNGEYWGTTSAQQRAMASFVPRFIDSTDATRKAGFKLNVYDTAIREVLDAQATGAQSALVVTASTTFSSTVTVVGKLFAPANVYTPKVSNSPNTTIELETQVGGTDRSALSILSDVNRDYWQSANPIWIVASNGGNNNRLKSDAVIFRGATARGWAINGSNDVGLSLISSSGDSRDLFINFQSSLGSDAGGANIWYRPNNRFFEIDRNWGMKANTGVRLYDADNSNYASFHSSAAMTTDIYFVLPVSTSAAVADGPIVVESIVGSTVSLKFASPSSGSADNLGNHLATTTLSMQGYSLTNIGTSSSVFGTNGNLTVNSSSTFNSTVTIQGISTGTLSAGGSLDLSAARLTIPSGTAPTATGTGQIAFDTTDGDLLMHDGSAQRVYATALTPFHVTISSWTDGWSNHQVKIFQAPLDKGITIATITACTSVVASTVTFQLEERGRNTPNVAGTDVFTVSQATANGTCAEYFGSAFTNPTMAAGTNIEFDTDASASSGTVPDEVSITVWYWKDVE